MKRLTLLLSTIVFYSILYASPAYTLDGQPMKREGLTKTFGDEFDSLSSYQEEGKLNTPGGGTWRRNYGYTWMSLDDVRNHTLIWNKEEQIYVDPLFKGTSNGPLNLETTIAKRGVLHIRAEKTTNPNLSGYRYISGLLNSEPTFTQTYGVFEMRAKLPKGRGLWPAFWLLPTDKSWPPEIDIMEVLGHEITKYYTTLHSKETGSHTKSDIPVHSVPDLSAGFHTYAVDWGPTETIFYFDDKEVARRPTPADMNKPFYILINLAVGGGWPGSPTAETQFPATMQVDWVRVWQRDEYVKKDGRPSWTGSEPATSADY